jgi:hypothetical protein
MTRKRFLSRPWTAADEERLKILIVAGKTIKDLSSEFQRSVVAIRAKSYQLGLSLKTVRVRRRAS